MFTLIFTSCGKSEAENEPTSVGGEITQNSGVLSDFTTTDIDGKTVNQSVFKGKKLTMVNIWATFCGPCINEMPDLGKISEDYADKGFQIIGIPVDVVDYYGNIDESQVELAKDIIDETGAVYLHILPSASLNQAKLSQVTSVPETIFVDESGNQVGESYIGSRSMAQWKEIIDGLMENM
ncbi:MAG: TlpA family protein disulfide reductase [Clostridia bacterium]|nr:TlpA family protein disulfide reductase [Clostridia bacterium]